MSLILLTRVRRRRGAAYTRARAEAHRHQDHRWARFAQRCNV